MRGIFTGSEHEHSWVKCGGCLNSNDKEYCGGVTCSNKHCKFNQHVPYVVHSNRTFPGYKRNLSLYEKFHLDERRVQHKK
jgi:hypothetical protein